jgi:hypothetical protein
MTIQEFINYSISKPFTITVLESSEKSQSFFPDPVISAIIAFIGVCISTGVSWFIVKKTSQNEKNKIHQENSKLLLQKRVEIYPKLWEIVSSIYGIKKAGGVPSSISRYC